MKRITVIPSICEGRTGTVKVAAYARVSRETDRLEHSLAAQVSGYSRLIQSTPGWEYAGVYVDDGITGTSTRARSEFNRLMADCGERKIDIVLTKSISRFARNTVDLIQSVRNLKSVGVEVRFEKDYIKSPPYTTYGRLSSNITLYIVFCCGILMLHVVCCRLLVA